MKAKARGFKESYLRTFHGSDMSVVVREAANGDGVSKSVGLKIVMRGLAARVPSLKNSRLQHNVLPAETLARLHAMDGLFRRATRGTVVPFFDKTRIHVTLICGRRSQLFDVDNCMATIRDWLEPPVKSVGQSRAAQRKGRGWGIGLVANDYFVTGAPFYGHQVGHMGTETIVLVNQWSTVRDKWTECVQSELNLFR